MLDSWDLCKSTRIKIQAMLHGQSFAKVAVRAILQTRRCFGGPWRCKQRRDSCIGSLPLPAVASYTPSTYIHMFSPEPHNLAVSTIATVRIL